MFSLLSNLFFHHFKFKFKFQIPSKTILFYSQEIFFCFCLLLVCYLWVLSSTEYCYSTYCRKKSKKSSCLKLASLGPWWSRIICFFEHVINIFLLRPVQYNKINRRDTFTIAMCGELFGALPLWYFQCCGSGPGSAFILVGWIRIRIGNSDPDPGGPKWPTKVKKIRSFEVLAVLFRGMKTSPVAWTSCTKA